MTQSETAAAQLLAVMPPAQVIILAEHIKAVQVVGFGTVTLEVKKGVVRFVIPAPHVELPHPQDGET